MSTGAAVLLAVALGAVGCTAILGITDLAPADAGPDRLPPVDAPVERGERDASRDARADGARDASTERADAADAATAAPRPVSPMSTSRVSSHRPTLTWVLPTGVSTATLDLCADRACTTPIGGTPTLVTGTSYVPTTDLTPGVVYWRLHPSTSTAITSPTWEFRVAKRGTPVNTSWGTTLDVNGDGYADVAIGAPGVNKGSVYVYLGGATGLATKATILTASDGAGGRFGEAVASAGDVNGDGYADLVVGAPGFMGSTGSAYVFLGSASGIATTPATSLTGPAGANGVFGKSVAGAGDLNNDGYGDVVIGANGVSSLNGAVYIYHGGPTGLASTYTAHLNGTSAENFGCSVATGDVNGDGFTDLIVGAYGAAGGAGGAYVFLGGVKGIVLPAAAKLYGPTGKTDLFGFSVANAGDINGDGLPDLIVGAWESSSQTGSAYVYLGGPGLVDAGMAEPSPSSVLSSPDGLGGYFGWSVAGGGDVNGDGYDDVIVGAPNTSPGQTNVYLGGASGLKLAPITLTSTTANEYGLAVASAGDVSGSGYAAVLVGAPAASTDGGLGNAYVYYGGVSGPGGAPSVTLAGPGTANSAFGSSVFGATN